MSPEKLYPFKSVKASKPFNLNSSSIHGRLSLDTQFTLTQSPDEKPNTAQFMNLHWQEWANSSLEFLGKKTPKEAAKDEEGRELLESFFLNLKKNSSNFDPRLIPDIENIKELIQHNQNSNIKFLYDFDKERSL